MKDAIILWKNEEITSIEVDNDSFYSDHIIAKRDGLMSTMERTQARFFALPHEFKPYAKLSEFHFKWIKKDFSTKGIKHRPRSMSYGLEGLALK
jgi:hypothetical protein